MPNQGVIITEDASQYYAVITTYGNKKIAQALATETPLQLKTIAVGDGGGSEVYPNREIKELVNEVWRGDCVTMLDLNNPNTIVAKTNVPIDVGGWNVREIAVMDDEDNIIIHANAPGWRKLAVINGTSNPMEISARVTVIDAAAIELNISYDGINVTFKDLDNHNKDLSAHLGHFQNRQIHVSTDDRENWDNPLIVTTVLLESGSWERDPEGVTFVQEVTAQLPEETVLPNMDLAIKADPNLTAQMVDKDIGLVAEQTDGRIVVHALREAPDINMYLQVSLYRSKSGEEKTYYSNLLGNPGEIGTPLPLPIEKGSIHLEDQSTAEQLKIHGTHINPSLDWAATRVVRGENTAPIGPTSGVQIMDGTETEFTDTYQLKAGVRYIYAYFPRNEAGNYQMSATTAEITIPTKVPQPPTNLQIKNSTDSGAFAATLTYEAPVDVYRDHFAIVRKEGSAPTSLEDGKIVYEGTDLTFRDTQSTNFGVEYFWTVFAVNAEGTVSEGSPSVSLTIQPIVPEQVTELTVTDTSAPEYGYRVMVKCKKPADVNAYKIMVRRKAGEMPATSIDGEQVYEGSNEIFYDMPVFSSQAYYYRAFTINQVGQMNDEQEGAVASVTLTAKEPGSVTNLAATDEKGTTTGSFDLPVVMLEGREVVNRFVAGYVVIQKEGSTPESETDGEMIESRDIDPTIAEKTVTFTKTEQKNGANLFITVFLKNHAGQYFISTGQTVEFVVEALPIYTFTGQHQLIDDGDGHWRIKFLSSGVLTWLSSNSKIDVFLVGGGAGGCAYYGGGGGYTKTEKNIDIVQGKVVQVYIGSGGAASSGSSPTPGGASSFDTISVNGASSQHGGSGGGGSVYGKTSDGGDGGTDGNKGGGYLSDGSYYHTYVGGNGQGSTTREFGDAGADLYSGGGGGCVYVDKEEDWGSLSPVGGKGGGGNPTLAESGTKTSGKWGAPGRAGGGYGGGGGSGSDSGGAGAQGIVIIRDARE